MKIQHILGFAFLGLTLARILQPYSGAGGIMQAASPALNYLLMVCLAVSGVYLFKAKTWQQIAFASLPFWVYIPFAVAYVVRVGGSAGTIVVYIAAALMPIAYTYQASFSARTIRGKLLQAATPSKLTGLVSLVTGADVLLRHYTGVFAYIQSVASISPPIYGLVLVVSGLFLVTFERRESGLFVFNLPMVIYALFFAFYRWVEGITYQPISIWLGYVAIITFCAAQIKGGDYAFLDDTLEGDNRPNPAAE